MAPKKTGVKKAPDIEEIGLSGDLDKKINFVKDNFSKEISESGSDSITASLLPDQSGASTTRDRQSSATQSTLPAALSQAINS